MLEGIVSCVRHAATLSENSYYISTISQGEPNILELKSTVVLKVGDFIEAEVSEDQITSAIIKKSDPAEHMNLIRAAMPKFLTKRTDGYNELITKTTLTMMQRLEAAALLFIEKLLLGAPIIIRFHNDADGATGAYGIYLSVVALAKRLPESKFAKIQWKMQRGVAYSVNDAAEDTLTIGNYDSITKPLLLITDFGTAEESLEGAAIVKERFDVIWLDHHPVVEQLAQMLENYINPWKFGGDSNYTAGVLSCEFGKRFADINLSEIEAASLIGDYSAYAQDDEQAKGLALLLDMLTSDKKIAISSGNNDLTPSEIDLILGNPKRRSDLTNYAKSRIEEAIDSGIEGLRKYKTVDADVYLLDFENVRKDSMTKYPLPGRYASKLLERIETMSDKPPVLVLHFGHFVSIRVSGQLEGKIDLLKIVNDLKSGYSYIDAAGGHKRAASIKLKTDQNKKELISALLRSLGCSIS